MFEEKVGGEWPVFNVQFFDCEVYSGSEFIAKSLRNTCKIEAFGWPIELHVVFDEI